MLPSEEQQDAERHLGACSRCRTLHGIIRGESEAPAPQSGDDLVLSILHRTSGPACSSAQQHLCDWIDGDLGADEREMISLHIAHCPDCLALTLSLNLLKEVLPGMATLDPGAHFIQEVLGATIGRRSAARSAPSQMGWWKWWSRLIRRPRCAWEAAYVGALVVLLTLGSPAVLSQLMPKALAVQQILAHRSDQLLQETSSALTKRQEEARRSISGLRLKGRTVLDAAADYPNRAISALRQSASTFLEELKLGLADENGADQRRRDLR